MSAKDARDRLAALLSPRAGFAVIESETYEDGPGVVTVTRPKVVVSFDPRDATALAADLTAGRAAIEAEKRVRALRAGTLNAAIRDAIHDHYCGVDRTCQDHCEQGGSGNATERRIAIRTARALVLAALDGAAPEPTIYCGNGFHGECERERLVAAIRVARLDWCHSDPSGSSDDYIARAVMPILDSMLDDTKREAERDVLALYHHLGDWLMARNRADPDPVTNSPGVETGGA